jgi:hypothetical protein
MIHLAPAEVKAVVRTSPRIGVPFAPIPLDVKARRDVSPAAKLVFATVANQARMRKGDVSSLTNRRISDRAGLNVASVRRALDQLEALGLVRRLFGDSKRIRLGIAVSYSPAEVAQGRATSIPGVAQGAQPGCSPAPQGGCAPRATDLLRSGEEHPKTVSRSGWEDDPASRVASGPEAAAYLRACIEAGRKGLQPPPPPAPAKAIQASQDGPTDPPAPIPAPAADRPATAKPAASTATIANAAQPKTAGDRTDSTHHAQRMTAANHRPDSGFRPCNTVSTYSPMVPASDVMATVRRMVGGLAEGLKAEDLGRRRVGPKRLAAQLAEVRRRHGRPAGS